MFQPTVLASDKTPEELLGLPPAKRPVNWEAFKLVFDAQHVEGGSRFSRERKYKEIRKAVEKHGIGILLPSMRLSYVCARLYLGDFTDWWGWEFRGFYSTGPERTWAADLYWSETWLPKWGGGFVPRLLVLGEQGIGDQIFYASVIPEAMIRCQEVVYECDNRLHTLLERSLPGLRCESERPFEDRREDLPPTAYIPAAELLRMFRRDRKHFPGTAFLRADPVRLASLRQYIGRTGIGWSGRQGRIEPEAFAVDNPLSLQWNEEGAVESPPLDLKDDIEGVVALCSVLERVVCVPSSIHHMAGATGTRVEVITPAYGSGEVKTQLPWDYSPITQMPWYSNCKVYESLYEYARRGERHGRGRRDHTVGLR